ncbi:MAG: hypothetical protein ACTS73_06565 [Arsenophonus sp. NEOnobi-MAG3]
MNRRIRIYFTNDKQSLLGNGKQIKHRLISDRSYWVIPNTNTNRKCNMIKLIM